MWEWDCEESWAPKNWCFWTVVLEKTLESPLDCKEIQPVHPKGDQSWVFIGRTDVETETPILWPPDVKSWLIVKDPDAGKLWGQEENGMTEDEMDGWHHRLDEHGFGWTPGVGDGQGGPACCGSRGCIGLDMTEWLNWTTWKKSYDQPRQHIKKQRHHFANKGLSSQCLPQSNCLSNVHDDHAISLEDGISRAHYSPLLYGLCVNSQGKALIKRFRRDIQCETAFFIIGADFKIKEIREGEEARAWFEWQSLVKDYLLRLFLDQGSIAGSFTRGVSQISQA